MTRRPDTGPGPAPDRGAALDLYRLRAGIYDWQLAPFEALRCLAIDRLALRRGDAVLDVACGTGLSLPLIGRAVGRTGRIVGIEQSPEMIERARERIPAAQGADVTLICSPVESARFETRADAALFHFTHDVLRRPDAVDNVLRHLRPGAVVVASGLKWAPPGPLWPVNFLVLAAALHSVTLLDGLEAPWSLLEARIGPMRVEPTYMEGAYVASGVLPGPRRQRSR